MSEWKQIVSVPRHIKDIMQTDGVYFTINHHIDVNIAASFGIGLQTSNTSDWSVVNGFKCFKDITLVDNVQGSCTVCQPIIIQCALVYSIIVGNIIIWEVKVLAMLRWVEGDSTGCDIASHLNHYSWELWVAICGISYLISGMFVQISFSFAFLLLQLVFVLAVIGFVVEASIVSTGICVPFVAVIHSITSQFAMFAI